MVSVLNTVDTSHEDLIHDAQLDYYGTKLATCSSDCSIKVFDIRAGQQNLVATLSGHEGPVWQVSWSHPKFGSLLASCGYDRKVIVWKENNGQWSSLREFTQYESSVNCVAWAPHDYGLVLAAASSDCSITVISSNGEDWETKKIPSAHLIGVNAVSWAPAMAPGSLLDGSDGQLPAKRLVSGGGDNLVKIWREEQNGEWLEEHRLEAHSDWVRDVAWAPSIGLGASCIASCSQDGRVLIWRCSDAGRWESQLLENFPEVVWHLSWSLCGSILAVATGDNKVSLWKETVDAKWNCISDAKKGQPNE